MDLVVPFFPRTIPDQLITMINPPSLRQLHGARGFKTGPDPPRPQTLKTGVAATPLPVFGAAMANQEGFRCGREKEVVDDKRHSSVPQRRTTWYGAEKEGETLVQVCDNPPVSGGWDWVAVSPFSEILTSGIADAGANYELPKFDSRGAAQHQHQGNRSTKLWAWPASSWDRRTLTQCRVGVAEDTAVAPNSTFGADFPFLSSIGPEKTGRFGSRRIGMQNRASHDSGVTHACAPSVSTARFHGGTPFVPTRVPWPFPRSRGIPLRVHAGSERAWVLPDRLFGGALVVNILN
ncbi:hypothetical protein CPLU01_12186 [Colletotrichum plurivorum]|uniref:Uncharacterized protein n=1 Tax=Colletotrichum plurivorum TaxID=2175906 RepID=A0A8H6N7E8_9PEZI|nr:hypothetical protein CPLU01_12186 [Colletotrichum plurivorum]